MIKDFSSSKRVPPLFCTVWTDYELAVVTTQYNHNNFFPLGNKNKLAIMVKLEAPFQVLSLSNENVA